LGVINAHAEIATMVMLASYGSSQNYAGVLAIVTVEIGISPRV